MLLCVHSFAAEKLRELDRMKFEVLSHLVLRLVVGSFMLAHSLYTLVMYESYVEKLMFYLSNLRLLNNEFFTMAAPLFPFIELIVSTLLLLGVCLHKSVLCSFILIALLATVLFFLGQVEILSILAFILGALVFVLQLFKRDENFSVLNGLFGSYK